MGNIMTGTLEGNNKDLNFETKLNWEATLNVVFTIGNITFIDKTNRLNLYAYVGYGLISYGNPIVHYKNTNTDTTRDGSTEGILPVGAGLKYRLSDRFVIHGEYTLHATNVDDIDGYEVNLSEDDDFSYANIGINYILGKQEKAIEWVNPLSTIYNDLYDVKDRVDMMSGDKDKDGVADMFDREPATPEGTKVYGDGTSVDSDADGVADSQDADPFSSKGAKVDGNGKEVDGDGDSVPDSRDMEPNTGKGQLVDARGIGIPGSNMEGGKVTSTSGGMESVYLPSVFFAYNSMTVADVYNETLASIALVLKNNPNINMNVVGHCDAKASEGYNQKLGMKRAEAVKSVLMKKFHIDGARLNATTKGESDMLSKNDPRMDRRVDFSIAK
jgi:OOP family OmpA-OmpF porin